MIIKFKKPHFSTIVEVKFVGKLTKKGLQSAVSLSIISVEKLRPGGRREKGKVRLGQKGRKISRSYYLQYNKLSGAQRCL